MTDSNSDASRRTAGYVFLSAVVGLAAVLYFAYTSFFVLGKMCLLCTTVYVAVTGIFLLSSTTAADTLNVLPSRLGTDLKAVFTSPFAVGLAVLWLAGSASLVGVLPARRLCVQPDGIRTGGAGTAAAETLTERAAGRMARVARCAAEIERAGAAAGRRGEGPHRQVQRLPVPGLPRQLSGVPRHRDQVGSAGPGRVRVPEQGFPARIRVRVGRHPSSPPVKAPPPSAWRSA